MGEVQARSWMVRGRWGRCRPVAVQSAGGRCRCGRSSGSWGFQEPARSRRPAGGVEAVVAKDGAQRVGAWAARLARGVIDAGPVFPVAGQVEDAIVRGPSAEIQPLTSWKDLQLAARLPAIPGSRKAETTKAGPRRPARSAAGAGLPSEPLVPGGVQARDRDTARLRCRPRYCPCIAPATENRTAMRGPLVPRTSRRRSASNKLGRLFSSAQTPLGRRH